MTPVKFSHWKLWIIRVIRSNQGQHVLDLWHARIWHLRERRIIMTIVKWKFQERSWLRRKRHNFKPGSSVDEIMIQTKACSPLHSQSQGQIPPCTSLSQISESRPLTNIFKHTDLREELNKGGGFVLPRCIFPNVRIHEHYVMCLIKTFHAQHLTPLERVTFSSLILYSYD